MLGVLACEDEETSMVFGLKEVLDYEKWSNTDKCHFIPLIRYLVLIYK